jgi:carboxyl-terminal processing protease
MEAVKKLRGAPGTSVKLMILREGENQLREFTVTRDIIKIQSIREAKVLEPGIAYIRVSDFRENTPEDIERALEKLKGEEMEGLIIDLRNNPGGLLDVTVEVAELFLERNLLIVSTKGRLKNQNLEFKSRADDRTEGIPMVVLVNEGSASASEIFAGAMQDHKRGILLGTTTHGKASVQTIFPMKDGSALKLTTSKYFTPAGRMIHGQGIVPDVVVPFEAPPETKEGEVKPQPDEIFDSIEHPEEPAKKKAVLDNQLSRAVDLLKGIKVYQSSRKTGSSRLGRRQPETQQAHR